MKKKLTVYLIILIILVLTFVLILRSCTKIETDQALDTSKSANGANEIGNRDNVTKIFFASNGKDSVYKIKKEDKWAVIFNGIEGKEYDYVSNPVFSPDGTQLAYGAELDGQAYVVVNNIQELNAYQGSASIVFSPDGRTISYVAYKENDTVVVFIDGQESQEYEGVGSFQAPTGTTSIIYSPDGSQVVYVVQEGNQSYVVVNNQPGQKYDDITEIYFGDDGLTYEATQGSSQVTVVNNQVVSETTASTTSQTNTTETVSPSSSTPTPTSQNDPPPASYRYKKITDKDINNSNDSQLNYSTCPQGSSCNF